MSLRDLFRPEEKMEPPPPLKSLTNIQEPEDYAAVELEYEFGRPWGALLKQTFVQHQEGLYKGFILVWVVAMLLMVWLVNRQGQQTVCVEALRTPGTQVAVIMEVCR